VKRSSIWFVAGALLVAGCAAQPDVVIEQGVSLAKFTQVEVTPAANETGSSDNDQAAQTFGDDLRSALQSEGVAVSESGPPASTLVVKPALAHYEAGSAIARWILPGAGRTQASVSASLVDKATGESLGDLAASDQIAAGGLYTIGQDRLILSRLANGFAKEIAQRIRSQ
jgi:Domain of unknown function (DUF4410)